MIKPVNGHLLIEPVTHSSFIASAKETYEEVGIIRAVAIEFPESFTVKVGDKVFFDSWLAAKYPKLDSEDDEFYWLVKWEDVRGIEYGE